MARKSATATCHPTLEYGDFDLLFAELATVHNIIVKIPVQGANILPVFWRLPCLQPSSPPCCSTAVSQLTIIMFSKMAPESPEETLKHASMSLIRHSTLSWPAEYCHCRLECCLPVFHGRLELFRRTLLGTTPLLRGSATALRVRVSIANLSFLSTSACRLVEPLQTAFSSLLERPTWPWLSNPAGSILSCSGFVLPQRARLDS